MHPVLKFCFPSIWHFWQWHAHIRTHPPRHTQHITHTIYFLFLFSSSPIPSIGFAVLLSNMNIYFLSWTVRLSENSGLYFDAEVDHTTRNHMIQEQHVTIDSWFVMCIIHLRYISTSKFIMCIGNYVISSCALWILIHLCTPSWNYAFLLNFLMCTRNYNISLCVIKILVFLYAPSWNFSFL